MARYVVKVVSPSGLERYISQGHFVSSQDAATRYPHPSAARRAGESFCKRRSPDRFVWAVVDTSDPEKVVM